MAQEIWKLCGNLGKRSKGIKPAEVLVVVSEIEKSLLAFFGRIYDWVAVKSMPVGVRESMQEAWLLDQSVLIIYQPNEASLMHRFGCPRGKPLHLLYVLPTFKSRACPNSIRYAAHSPTAHTHNAGKIKQGIFQNKGKIRESHWRKYCCSFILLFMPPLLHQCCIPDACMVIKRWGWLGEMQTLAWFSIPAFILPLFPWFFTNLPSWLF